MQQILIAILTLFALTTSVTAGTRTEIEPFSVRGLTNDFFLHEPEFDDPCCWEVLDPFATGDFELHLRPNFWLITFDLQPGESVQSISVELQDFEGGNQGDDPTSVVIVRASSNDFVALHASQLGVEETVTASVDSIGQLNGEPLGDIVSIRLDAANEGNSEVPGFGALFDDITIVIETTETPGDLDGNGTVNGQDLLMLLNAWGSDDAEADLDGNGTVAGGDLLILLNNWG